MAALVPSGCTYHVPLGSELVLDHVRWRVVGRDGDGYAVEGLDDGECCTLQFDRVIEAIKVGDCQVITPAMSEKRKKLLEYTGGIEHVSQLPADEQRDIQARKGLVLAMEALETDGANLTQRYLDRRDVRAALKTSACILMGDRHLFHNAYIGNPRDPHAVPKGRTLQEMFLRFKEHGREAIVLLRKHHAKGPQGEARRKLDMLQEWFITLVLDTYQKLTKPLLATIYYDMLDYYLTDYPDIFPSDFRAPSLTTVRTRLKQITAVVKGITRDGYKWAKNKFGAGSTGTRALTFGVATATDQVYLSIFVDGKGTVAVRALSKAEQETDLAENEIHRIWLHILIDIATRYPLAWVLAETPDGDHQRSLMRMATRDKTREKLRYGCMHDPAPPVGIASVKSDNGSATRNADMFERLLGVGTTVQMNRTYNSTDNAYAERLIGTLQFRVLNTLPGYTGSRPGELNGYDGKKEAKISFDDLMGIITRFFVDEYPHEIHRGTGMFGMSPHGKLKASVAEYGAIPAPDWEARRIHLGERQVATTTSEGVRVLGIPFNSSELQAFAAGASKEVTVFLDPDDLREVTIFSSDSKQKMTAHLTMTDFADMTLEETIDLMTAAVEYNPDQQQMDRERLRVARARRASESGYYSDPRLPPNFRTMEQLKAQVAQIGNVEFIPMSRSLPTTPAGSIMNLLGNATPARPLEPQSSDLPAEDAAAEQASKAALPVASPEIEDTEEPKPMFTPITRSKL